VSVTLSFERSLYPEDVLAEELEKRRLTDIVTLELMPFLRLPETELLEGLKELADAFRGNFTTLVVVGMGGSSLGTKTLNSALRHRADRKLLFLDNIDPPFVAKLFREIRWSETAFAFVSKSGRTLETVTLLNLIVEQAKKTLPRWREHAVLIGSPGGAFRKLAQELEIPFLSIPEDVEGRFSAFTSVGLFPCAFAGYSVDGILEGVESVLKAPADALKLGLWKHLEYLKGKRVSVLMVYSSLLKDFTDWYIQLWAESLGKRGYGQTPVGFVGTPLQHSVFQLFMEGPEDKLFQLVSVEKHPSDISLPGSALLRHEIAGRKLSEIYTAELTATAETLFRRKRPIVTINLSGISEFTVAKLLATYMVATVVTAHLAGVNPYGQPAVEERKRLSLELIRKFQE